MTIRSCSLTTALAFTLTLVGCGGAPRPEARLASSEGAIRGAQEAGASQVPDATLHVTLAQEQRQQALELIKRGDNHRAAMVLARSEADAELAIALARAASAQTDATKSEEAVETLQQKAQP
jgi:hypothetical protein